MKPATKRYGVIAGITLLIILGLNANATSLKEFAVGLLIGYSAVAGLAYILERYKD
jgi:hypothetical protein